MEPVENGASDVMGPGRVGLELSWCYNCNKYEFESEHEYDLESEYDLKSESKSESNPK